MSISFFDMHSEIENISDEINHAVLETLKSGHYILGPKLEAFESDFSRFCQTKFCFGVGNGLDALTLALRAAGIGTGDLVAIPGHTFIATALAVIAAGADPYLVDIDPETYTLDPKSLEAANDPRIKAVMPVHLYGNPCEMDTINKIAFDRKWIVIEDNAQAHGATFKGKRTGSLGHLAGASFYPTKNLGAFGDAGAITTSSESFAQNIAWLRNYGQSEKYNHVTEGINSRLDEIQAAILSVKLKYLESSNKKRQMVAQRYIKNLKNVGDLILPRTMHDGTHVYHLFVIRTERRNECQAFLQKKGITSLIHYPRSINKHPAFLNKPWNLGQNQIPNSEKACDQVLSLPIYPTLSENQIDIVCEAVHDFFTLRN